MENIDTEKMAIGVFDSGLGGLTVVKELIKLLPNEKIIYFGDTARVPYGSKSAKVVTKYSKEITKFLLTKQIKLLVIACNTASAMALDEVSKMAGVPVVGVIKPGSRRAVNTTRNGKIGVIGTRGTVETKSYMNEIKSLKNDAMVFQKACPLFVPLIEEGLINEEITLMAAKMYLDDVTNIDTMVLGCTHYPLIKDIIKETVEKDVILIDSAEETAIEVRSILYDKRILSKDKNGEPEFYVSDAPERFSEVGKLFLGETLKRAEYIDIEKFSSDGE